MKAPGIFGTACAAINCHIVKGVHDCNFYPFPQDEDRCKLWVIKCRRLDLFAIAPSTISNMYYLCEKHFDLSSMEDDDLETGSSSNELLMPTMFDFPLIRYQVPNVNSEAQVNKDLSKVVLPGGIHLNTLNRVVPMKDNKHFICGGPLLFPMYLNASSDSYVVAFDQKETGSSCIPRYCMAFVSKIQVDKMGSGSMKPVELFNICQTYLSKEFSNNILLITGGKINTNCCESVSIISKNDSTGSFLEKPLQDLIKINQIEANEVLSKFPESNEPDKKIKRLPNILKRRKDKKKQCTPVDEDESLTAEFYLASYVGLNSDLCFKETVLPGLLNGKKAVSLAEEASQGRNLPFKKVPDVREKLKTNIFGKKHNFRVTRSQIKSSLSSYELADERTSLKVDSMPLVKRGNRSGSKRIRKSNAGVAKKCPRNKGIFSTHHSFKNKKDNPNSSDNMNTNFIIDPDVYTSHQYEDISPVSDSVGCASEDEVMEMISSDAEKCKNTNVFSPGSSGDSNKKRKSEKQSQILSPNSNSGNSKVEKFVILNQNVKRRIPRGPFSCYVTSDGSKIENTSTTLPNDSKKYYINLNSIYKEIDNLSITDKLKNKLRASVAVKQKGVNQKILARKKFVKIPMMRGKGKITARYVNKVLQSCLGKNTVKVCSSSSGFTCVDTVSSGSLDESSKNNTAVDRHKDTANGFSVETVSEQTPSKCVNNAADSSRVSQSSGDSNSNQANPFELFIIPPYHPQGRKTSLGPTKTKAARNKCPEDKPDDFVASESVEQSDVEFDTPKEVDPSEINSSGSQNQMNSENQDVGMKDKELCESVKNLSQDCESKLISNINNSADKPSLHDKLTPENSSGKEVPILTIKQPPPKKNTVSAPTSISNSSACSLPQYISDIVSKITSTQDFKFYKQAVSPATTADDSTSVPCDDPSFILPPSDVPINSYKTLKVFDVPTQHKDVPNEVKAFIRKSGKKVTKLLLLREYPIKSQGLNCINKLNDPLSTAATNEKESDSELNSFADEMQHNDDYYELQDEPHPMENIVVQTITLTDGNDDFSTVNIGKLTSLEEENNCVQKNVKILPANLPPESIKSAANPESSVSSVNTNNQTGFQIELPDNIKQIIKDITPQNGQVFLLKGDQLNKENILGNLIVKNTPTNESLVTLLPGTGNRLILKNASCTSLPNSNNVNFKTGDKVVEVGGTVLPETAEKSNQIIQINKVFEGHQPKRKMKCFCKGNPYPLDIRCFASESKVNQLPEAFRVLGNQILALKTEMGKLRKTRNRYRIEKERYKNRRIPIKFDDVMLELEKMLKPEAFQVIFPSLQFSHKDLVVQGFRYSEELKRICAKILLCGGWKPYLYLSSFLSLPGRTTMIQYIHDQINLVKSGEANSELATVTMSSVQKTHEHSSSPERSKPEHAPASDTVTSKSSTACSTNVSAPTLPVDQLKEPCSNISYFSQPSQIENCKSFDSDTLLFHAKDVLSYGSVENVFIPKEVTKKVQYVPAQKKGVRKKKTQLSTGQQNIKKVVCTKRTQSNNYHSYNNIKKSIDSILIKGKSPCSPVLNANKCSSRSFQEVFGELMENMSKEVETDQECEPNPTESTPSQSSQTILTVNTRDHLNAQVLPNERHWIGTLSTDKNNKTFEIEVEDSDDETLIESYGEEMEVVTYIELDT